MKIYLSVTLGRNAKTFDNNNWRIKVSQDDATLLDEIRDSISMEHCSTLFQGVASVSNNVGLRELVVHRQTAS